MLCTKHSPQTLPAKTLETKHDENKCLQTFPPAKRLMSNEWKNKQNWNHHLSRNYKRYINEAETNKATNSSETFNWTMNRSNFFDQAMNSSKPFSQICTIHSYALLSSREWFKYIQASCEQFKLHQVKDISDTVPSSHERFKPIQWSREQFKTIPRSSTKQWMVQRPFYHAINILKTATPTKWTSDKDF